MEERINWTRLTTSGTVSNKACEFYGIIVTPDGTNNSYADIHNGDNSTEPKFGRVRAIATDTRSFMLPKPTVLDRGFHIVFETNLSEVTVLWAPLRRETGEE